MRIFFPTLNQPKKAAKHFGKLLNSPLSSVHNSLAKACGYRDWHDLEKNFDKGEIVPNELLETETFIQQQSSIITTLARELGHNYGDVQYALATSFLGGNRRPVLDEQIRIRIDCWERTDLPPAGRRQPGERGKLNSAGLRKEPVILRSYGQGVTKVISHSNLWGVADFEYVSPRHRLPLFLPMRLYLPYGIWTEPDGAKVLFSRDYKPLWRIRDNQKPERVEPWLWIKYTAQEFFWGDKIKDPWDDPAIKRRMEQYLLDNAIQTLPILVEALPILINNKSVRITCFSDVVEHLEQSYSGSFSG